MDGLTFKLFYTSFSLPNNVMEGASMLPTIYQWLFTEIKKIIQKQIKNTQL